MFAWADSDVHQPTYDYAEYDQYVAGRIRPYKNDSGEVDFYRLELTSIIWGRPSWWWMSSQRLVSGS
jgi:hypothetical protein